ncbi:MAG: ATP-binding protein [Bacteroidota bacterium]
MSQVFTFLFDYPIISLFLLGNLLMGIWSKGRMRVLTFRDYATASQSLPIGILIMTLLATRLGSTDLADAGFVFQYGMLETVMTLTFMFTFFLVGTFVAPFFVYFQDCMTLGDIMERLYGRVLKIVTGILCMAFSVIILTAQVKAVALISGRILHISANKAILWCLVVIILYSIWGGMRSVSYTDVPQVIVTLSVLLFITQTLIQKVGGISVLLSKLPTEKMLFSGSPYFGHKLASLVFWGIFPTFLLTPPTVQRMLIVHDKRLVRRMWYASAVLYGLIRFLIVLIGLCALVDQDKLKLGGHGKELLPRLIGVLFMGQDTVQELIFIGFLGILLSTMSSYLHVMSVIMVQDIIVPVRKFFYKKALHPQSKAVYARIGVGVMGCMAILIGFYSEPTLEDVQMHRWAVLFFNIVLVPLLIGLFGIKTDVIYWVGFCVVYLATGVFSYAWGADIYISFFIGMFLGCITFFLVHYLVNDGFVIIRRSEQTVTEQLWLPKKSKIWAKIRSWMRLPLQLPEVTRRLVLHYPAHSVAFSVFIFGFYSFVAVTTRGMEHEIGITRFMWFVHIIGIGLCAGLLFEGLWHLKLRPYFALYWHVTLLYCLPFAGTLTFLKTYEGIFPVIQWFLLWICLLVLVNTFTFVVLLSLGTSMGYLLYTRLVDPSAVSIYEKLPAEFSWLTMGLVFFGTLLFKYLQERHIRRKIYVSYVASKEVEHEVREPLALLSGLGHLIGHTLIDGKVMKQKGEEGMWLSKKRYGTLKKHIHEIESRTKEVSDQIEQFSNLLQQQILGAFVQKEVHIRSLVEDAIEKIPDKYRRKVHVSMECMEDFEANLLANVFSNVIFYLVKNAYQHGEASEVIIKIDGKKRTIYVRDDGKGIPPDVLPRVFDLFYRTKNGGGIGLSLVKMIVEASGGKVTCYAKHGGKKTFTEVVMKF